MKSPPSAPAPLIAGGLGGSLVLNPDPLNPANPDIANSELFNPDIANPDIANPDIANPDIANPDIANPDIANPDIANPDIANPDIANPDIANPDIANPDIANPDIANPDIANGAISDATWKLTNKGNTTATYTVQFLLNGVIPNSSEDAAGDPQDLHDAGRQRLQPGGTAAHRGRGQHQQPDAAQSADRRQAASDDPGACPRRASAAA